MKENECKGVMEYLEEMGIKKEHFIKQERFQKARLSFVIEKFLEVDLSKKEIRCPCPFHEDTRESMLVNDDIGLYWCFECNDGGDEIHFVKRFLKVSLFEAREEIKRRLL